MIIRPKYLTPAGPRGDGDLFVAGLHQPVPQLGAAGDGVLPGKTGGSARKIPPRSSSFGHRLCTLLYPIYIDDKFVVTMVVVHIPTRACQAPHVRLYDTPPLQGCLLASDQPWVR